MTRFALVTILVAACGTSGGSGSPQQACDDLATTMCGRLYTCLTPQERQAAGLPADEAQCGTQYQQQFGCATAACPSGQSYHADQADLCVQQVGDLDCSAFMSQSFDVNTAAPACGKVCS
jgi:hypothetical protein